MPMLYVELVIEWLAFEKMHKPIGRPRGQVFSTLGSYYFSLKTDSFSTRHILKQLNSDMLLNSDALCHQFYVAPAEFTPPVDI